MIAVARADDPNLQILHLAATTLGDLGDSLVFVGGCATGLLVTAVRAQAIRATQDVDVVVAVASVQEYHAIEQKVAECGFAHDRSAGAPICRWVKQGLRLDLMPSEARILGFTNRWYPLAIETAARVELGFGLSIRLVSPPVFLGTKLEAFHGRGRADFPRKSRPGRHNHSRRWSRRVDRGSSDSLGGASRLYRGRNPRFVEQSGLPGCVARTSPRRRWKSGAVAGNYGQTATAVSNTPTSMRVHIEQASKYLSARARARSRISCLSANARRRPPSPGTEAVA